jgi:hypothetical protein
LTNIAVGKSVRHLKVTDFIQLAFGQLKPGAKILSGSIIITVNSAVRIQLPILAQVVDSERRFFIRDVALLQKQLQ